MARAIRNAIRANLAPAILQKCVGGFLLYKCWRIFAGIFLEDFSGQFSDKNEEKKSARKSEKKSGGPKIKIREKSVLPKADPNESIHANHTLLKHLFL